MSKRIILEVVNSGGVSSSSSDSNRDRSSNNNSSNQVGVGVGVAAMNKIRTDPNVLKVMKGLSKPYDPKRFEDLIGFRLKTQANELMTGATGRDYNKTADALEQMDKEYKEEYKASLALAKQERMKRIKKATGITTAVVHYGAQAFALYNNHLQNTYKMSGMTSASLRQQKIAQAVSLSQDAVSTSVAFMLNPLLGATQLAMTAITKASSYIENMRQFEYQKSKEQYSTNYYRSRLVNNTRVVI